MSLESVSDADNRAEKENSIKITAGTVFAGARPRIVDFVVLDLAEPISSVLYGAAGSDTTLAGTETMLLALLVYPEVQRKAQRELDLVLRGRLPTLDDVQEIPYISALVKEVLRWQAVTPVGKCVILFGLAQKSHFANNPSCTAFCIRSRRLRRIFHSGRCYRHRKCLVGPHRVTARVEHFLISAT